MDEETSLRTCRGVLEYLASDFTSNNNDTDATHIPYLSTALAILLESTSPGPDPLLMKELGWGYGMGASGDMGDWGACHNEANQKYSHTSVALETLETRIRNGVSPGTHDSTNSMNSTLPHRARVPPTRFCTVGGLPSYVQPYFARVSWSPPLAGVCVPSSCTHNSLRTLFGDANEQWREELLSSAKATALGTSYRQYDYLSSLTVSISTGIHFQMGIECEGETGLVEMDDAYLVGNDVIRSYGFWGMIGLIGVLLLCVTLATILSFVANQAKKRCRFSDVIVESIINSENKQTTSSNSAENGQTMNTENEKLLATSEQFVDTSGPLYGTAARTHILPHTKHYELIPITRQSSYELIPIIRRSSIHLRRIPYYTTVLNRLAVVLSPFDVTQNLSDITRKTPATTHWPLLNTTIATHLPTTNNAPHSISTSSSQILNGMRSISMLWIILGHTLVVMSSIGYQNPSAVLPPTGFIATSIWAMVFFASRYAVDTFFFIGGYLVKSNLLQRLDVPNQLPNHTRRRHKPSLGEEDDEEDDEEDSRVMEWLVSCHIINPNHVVLGDYAHRLNHNKSYGSSTQAVSVAAWWPPFILHRILRILPTYGFCILLWWKVAIHLGMNSGPYWSHWSTFVAQCDAYAWTNFLFVNNLVPWDQELGESGECMYHAWYIGIDFQLCAVLTPIFVTLFLQGGNATGTDNTWRRRTMGLEVVSVLIIIVMSIVNSYQNDWSGHLFDGKQTYNFDRDFYIKPWYRATPYIIGFLCAGLWHEKSRLCPNLGLTKCVGTILSLFSISILLFLVFVGSSAYQHKPCIYYQDVHTDSCGSGWDKPSLALYNSLVRPAWSIALLIMTLLSFNGQFTALGASMVLNWNGWNPLSRLSFGMYLLHPMVIQVWFLSRTSKFYYSGLEFLFLYAGAVSVTFMCSLLLGLVVEWPMSKITKKLEHRLWENKQGR